MKEVKSDDYLFFVKWADESKKDHTVGVLAYINGTYYLKGRDITRINKGIRGSKFFGIPPYNDMKLHQSDELFDFFSDKISIEARKSPESIFYGLLEKNAKTHIDSYTVAQIKGKTKQEIWKSKILELAEALKKAEKLKKANGEAR